MLSLLILECTYGERLQEQNCDWDFCQGSQTQVFKKELLQKLGRNTKSDEIATLPKMYLVDVIFLYSIRAAEGELFTDVFAVQSRRDLGMVLQTHYALKLLIFSKLSFLCKSLTKGLKKVQSDRKVLFILAMLISYFN